MMVVAGVDVGGTNIEVGLVDDRHRVRARAKHDTPTSSPRKIARTIVKLIEGLGEVPSAIGIGIPGVVHDDRVLEAPNLAGWDASFDIVSEIEDHFGVPIALGTCGRRGCIEAYAGRRSMEAAAAAMVDAGRHTSVFDIQHEEKKSTLTSKVWARALAEGDELAVELFDTAVEVVAGGIGSAINLIDVQLVVIGGGMAEKLGQDLADRIKREARPWILHPSPKLKFVVSALGDDAGIVGAAAIGRARLLDT